MKQHTRRFVRPALAAVVLASFLAPVWSETFDWNAAVAIESSVSVGDLADAVEVAPGDFGGDALLDRDDLRAAGQAGYEVQTVFRSSADGEVRAVWTSPGVALELAFSALVLQSPSGYGGDGFAFAPGPGGVRVVRSPSSWSGGRLMVWLGRELLADPTGLVARQLADGAGFAIRYPRLYISLGAGATGLVDKYLFDSRMLEDDRTVYADSTAAFAPPRLIALARVEYGDILANDLGVFAAYYDARSAGAQGDAWYGGLVADGVIAGQVTHRSSLVLQGRGAGESAAVLASSDVTLSLDGPRLSLTAGGLYGSADGGSLSRFEAISTSFAGRVIAVPYGDLVRASLEAVFEPFADSRFVPSVRGDIFLTPGRRTIGDAWLGAEMIGGIVYRLLDDLVITADAGVAHSPLGWTPYGRMQGRLEL